MLTLSVAGFIPKELNKAHGNLCHSVLILMCGIGVMEWRLLYKTRIAEFIHYRDHTSS